MWARIQIIAQAINDGMDFFYREALLAEKLKPLGTPEADISSAPSASEIEKPLVISLEVEVRPEFKLPDYKGIAK